MLFHCDVLFEMKKKLNQKKLMHGFFLSCALCSFAKCRFRLQLCLGFKLFLKTNMHFEKKITSFFGKFADQNTKGFLKKEMCT